NPRLQNGFDPPDLGLPLRPGSQPNARSAQTGEADKLMERSADHDPTGWAAPRTMIKLDGAQSAPSRLNRFQLFPMLVYLHDGVVYIVHFLAFRQQWARTGK